MLIPTLLLRTELYLLVLDHRCENFFQFFKKLQLYAIWYFSGGDGFQTSEWPEGGCIFTKEESPGNDGRIEIPLESWVSAESPAPPSSLFVCAESLRERQMRSTVTCLGIVKNLQITLSSLVTHSQSSHEAEEFPLLFVR